jgi:hypothetical protein
MEGVLTGIHQTTNSALYLAERGKVGEAAQKFQRKLQEIYGGWTSLDNGTQARMFLPLVVVEPVSISSTATNSSFITRSPETFLIRARVRNLSGNAVTNFQAVLHVGGRTNGIANLAELSVPKVLNLESKDGSTGSGTDEAMLEWELDYAGALIEAQIELYIEGLAAPNYAVVGTEMGLHVDAGIYDADADGLPDDWEALHGLSITENDAALDSDGDGVSNENEFRLGTAPNNSDTDGDGLSDGLEIAGAMGFKTNPRLKDSDSDGTFDNLDGAPNDAASSTETFLYDEPTVEVGTRTVILTRNRPFAFVDIRNAGEGELFWSATVSNPNLITTSGSSSPQLNTDSVLISVSSSFDFNAADVAVSTVTISDNAGQSLDAQQITVIITGGFNSETALSVGVDEGTFRLSWAAVAGQTYLVQYSENLNTWTTAADGTFVADRDGVLRWTDSGPPGTTSPPAGALQRFYRVITAPQE